MQRHPEWHVVNRGVSGQRTDEILRRFGADVVAAKPDVVVVLAGVNDLYQGKSVWWVTWHLRRIYARARRAHIRTVACTILPYNGASEEVRGRMQDVNEWIMDYTREHQDVIMCDTARSVEDPTHPGQLSSTDDGLHPDVEGYRRLGSALIVMLEYAFNGMRQ